MKDQVKFNRFGRLVVDTALKNKSLKHLDTFDKIIVITQIPGGAFKATRRVLRNLFVPWELFLSPALISTLSVEFTAINILSWDFYDILFDFCDISDKSFPSLFHVGFCLKIIFVSVWQGRRSGTGCLVGNNFNFHPGNYFAPALNTF